MKCDKCGNIVNPGDQICINCGGKLSTINVYTPEVGEKSSIMVDKKKNHFFLFAITIILILIIVTFLIIKFLALKR